MHRWVDHTTMPIRRTIFLLCVFIASWAEAESPSHSVHRNKAPVAPLPSSVILGVYMLMDRNISDDPSSSDDNFTSYAAALIGGVNVRLQEIKNHTIKLGLLRVILLGEGDKDRVIKTSSGTLSFSDTWHNLLSFNKSDLRRKESDIVYLITRENYFASSDSMETFSGVASTRGACTEDNAAISNDVLWSFAGVGPFAKNMADLMGASSYECEWDEKDPFSECRQEHLLANLRRIWPHCYGHSSNTDFISKTNYLPPGELNETLFCKYKAGSQGSGTCTEQANGGSGSSKKTECKITCCSGSKTYGAPDGVMCRKSDQGMCQGACFKERCVKRSALQRRALPTTDRTTYRGSLEWDDATMSVCPTGSPPP